MYEDMSDQQLREEIKAQRVGFVARGHDAQESIRIMEAELEYRKIARQRQFTLKAMDAANIVQHTERASREDLMERIEILVMDYADSGHTIEIVPPKED